MVATTSRPEGTRSSPSNTSTGRDSSSPNHTVVAPSGSARVPTARQVSVTSTARDPDHDGTSNKSASRIRTSEFGGRTETRSLIPSSYPVRGRSAAKRERPDLTFRPKADPPAGDAAEHSEDRSRPGLFSIHGRAGLTVDRRNGRPNVPVRRTSAAGA